MTSEQAALVEAVCGPVNAALGFRLLRVEPTPDRRSGLAEGNGRAGALVCAVYTGMPARNSRWAGDWWHVMRRRDAVPCQ